MRKLNYRRVECLSNGRPSYAMVDCWCSQRSCVLELDENSSNREDSSCQPLTSCSKTTAELLPLLKREKLAMVSFEADASFYEHLSIIGKGLNENAVVTAMRYVPSGDVVAVKRALLDKSQSNLDRIQKEVVDTRQLQHPNILPYFCSFVSNSEVWTVMPVQSFGSTRDLLDTYFTSGMPEIAILFILRDVFKGLNYIHKMGIIHRSIKASHILISECGQAVLSGLRYSYNTLQNGSLQRKVHQFPLDGFKNLNWLSPEVLQQNLQGYNCKSDIYSCGITACELANAIIPFSEMPSTKMLVEKLKGTTPSLVEDVGSDGDDDSYVKTYTQNFHDLVRKCLTQDPQLRPSALQLLSHLAFKLCKKSSVTFLDIINTIPPIVDITALKDKQDGKKDNAEVNLMTQKLDSVNFDVSWSF